MSIPALAIGMVKLRFFYEVILKKALEKLPDSISLMLLKSYISLDLFKNKYLTLTTITHISCQFKKYGYVKHLQGLISVNYFLKTILTTTMKNGINSNYSLGNGGNSNSEELDSTALLD